MYKEENKNISFENSRCLSNEKKENNFLGVFQVQFLYPCVLP